MHQLLIPAIYLQLAADKAASAQQRQELHHCSQALLDRVNATDFPLALLTESDKRLIESVTTECAQLFQQPHRNLFDYLVTQVDLPGRQAQKRRPPSKTSCLV